MKETNQMNAKEAKLTAQKRAAERAALVANYFIQGLPPGHGWRDDETQAK